MENYRLKSEVCNYLNSVDERLFPQEANKSGKDGKERCPAKQQGVTHNGMIVVCGEASACRCCRYADGHSAAVFRFTSRTWKSHPEERPMLLGLPVSNLWRGFKQFRQIIDVRSTRVADHKIAEAALTPCFHVERQFLRLERASSQPCW